MARLTNYEADKLMDIDGVTGFGYGGDTHLIVYLLNEEAAERVPPSFAGFRVKTEVTGVIKAQGD